MFDKKKFFILLILVISVMASGCFRISSDTAIHKDGSVDIKNTMVGVPLLAEQIQEARESAKKNHPNASLKDVQDGNMSGIEETTHYKTIDEMAKADGNMFKTVEGKAKGVQQKKGWLYDTYAVDVLFEGKKDTQANMDQDERAMMQAMLSSVRADVSLSLPYAAESHNADKVTSGGTTLTWDLASALMNGGDKSIQATFRIWNMTHIFITIGVAVVLMLIFLGGLIGGFFCRKGSLLQFGVFGLGFPSRPSGHRRIFSLFCHESACADREGHHICNGRQVFYQSAAGCTRLFRKRSGIIQGEEGRPVEFFFRQDEGSDSGRFESCVCVFQFAGCRADVREFSSQYHESQSACRLQCSGI